MVKGVQSVHLCSRVGKAIAYRQARQIKQGGSHVQCPLWQQPPLARGRALPVVAQLFLDLEDKVACTGSMRYQDVFHLRL